MFFVLFFVSFERIVKIEYRFVLFWTQKRERKQDHQKGRRKKEGRKEERRGGRDSYIPVLQHSPSGAELIERG